ncbi:MAG: hypothetical protein ACFFC7_23070 [Candidatus Hermodarchaeota archaeon]
MLLELALEGKIGATSALVAELTDKTKNTVHVRLEQLFYKRLIQKQPIGNAFLYYVPLLELLLRAITKELATIRINQGQVPADTPEEELEKSILAQYITDVRVLLGRSQTYFGNLSQQATLVGFNLKQKLLD